MLDFLFSVPCNHNPCGFHSPEAEYNPHAVPLRMTHKGHDCKNDIYPGSSHADQVHKIEWSHIPLSEIGEYQISEVLEIPHLSTL